MTPLPPLLLRGDCLVELQRIPNASIDAVVTDPPYGLDFMGKDWDNPAMLGQSSDPTKERGSSGGRPKGPGTNSRGYADHDGLKFEAWTEQWARECLRILKPGGHMLAFGGSRTWHRLAAGIEDAGFEIRDSIAWLYGSGFPKSLDVSKAIDKHLGAERPVTGLPTKGGAGQGAVFGNITRPPATAPATAWDGWGTALKPAFEPIVVARKPLVGTVAANVLAHRTGALNIDATRIGTEKRVNPPGSTNRRVAMGDGWRDDAQPREATGRWPANVALDESQAAALDEQAPKTGAAAKASGPTLTGETRGTVAYGARKGLDAEPAFHGDIGGASRFFYVAKAPKSERPVVDGTAHPTVKPLTLMRWLLRLVTPPGGVVVDPFAGSGTTLEAAYLEGFESIGVELTPDYWPLIEARIARAVERGDGR